MSCTEKDDLSSLHNLVAALFQLEQGRTEQDIQAVLLLLVEWLTSPEQTGLRRAFTVWINRVLLPRKVPGIHIQEFNDLQEAQTMLAETVKRWQEQALQEGLQKGLQEGRQEGLQKGLQEGRQEEATKLFLLLLESKFGTVSQLLQDKVRSASSEQIEAWTKQIFQAKNPEELLDG